MIRQATFTCGSSVGGGDSLQSSSPRGLSADGVAGRVADGDPRLCATAGVL